MRQNDDIVAKLKDLVDRADDMDMLKEDRITIVLAIGNIVSLQARLEAAKSFQPLKADLPRVKMHSGLKGDK